MLRRRMGIHEESAAAARSAIQAALERVAEASRGTGYLVGGRFGAADLTAACLLFPLFFPPQLPFELPRQESRVFEAWRTRWQRAPGADYVLGIWSKHR